MATVPATEVKKLRDRTGVSIALCQKALTETNCDMEAAVVWLRERNKDAQDKLGQRETAEGRIGAFVDPVKRVGALIELRCESAPVAKSDLFIALSNDLAKHVAYHGEAPAEKLLEQPYLGEAGKTVNARIGEVVGLMRENVKVARMARREGLLGTYVHHDGKTGVLLQVEGASADPQLLRDVCMHIAAIKPIAATREQVPQHLVNQEMEIARHQAQETGKNKPANIIEKIAEGKLRTWFAEKVLAEQPFVKDPSKTVGQLLAAAGLKPVDFVRLEVGVS
jgi:elongation factor Ts